MKAKLLYLFISLFISVTLFSQTDTIRFFKVGSSSFSNELADMVCDVAEASGDFHVEYQYTSYARCDEWVRGIASYQDFLDDYLNTINNGNFDYVIVQTIGYYDLSPAQHDSLFGYYMKDLALKVRAAGSEIILYDKYPSQGCYPDYIHSTELFHYKCGVLADINKISFGGTPSRVFLTHPYFNSMRELFSLVGHPGGMQNYISACNMSYLITGVSPVGVNMNQIESGWFIENVWPDLATSSDPNDVAFYNEQQDRIIGDYIYLRPWEMDTLQRIAFNNHLRQDSILQRNLNEPDFWAATEAEIEVIYAQHGNFDDFAPDNQSAMDRCQAYDGGLTPEEISAVRDSARQWSPRIEYYANQYLDAAGYDQLRQDYLDWWENYNGKFMDDIYYQSLLNTLILSKDTTDLDTVEINRYQSGNEVFLEVLSMAAEELLMERISQTDKEEMISTFTWELPFNEYAPYFGQAQLDNVGDWDEMDNIRSVYHSIWLDFNLMDELRDNRFPLSTWIEADERFLDKYSTAIQTFVYTVDDNDPETSSSNGYFETPANLSSFGDTYGSIRRISETIPDTNTFTWTPYLGNISGSSEIFVWFPTSSAAGVPYTISHDEGITTVLIDQMGNGGKWISIGNYNVSNGTYVQMSGAVSNDVRPAVDAVRYIIESDNVNTNPIENVVLNKPIIADSDHGASAGASAAVDGDHSTDGATRWVSASTAWPHWLNIDLQGSYTISQLKLWTGGNSYSDPIDFILQYWDGSQWIDIVERIGNTDAQVVENFTPVTVDSIRLLGTGGGDLLMRILDVEIYGSAPMADAYSLIITSNNGNVSRSPLRSSYTKGSTVEIEAIPSPGYEFVNWSGDTATTDNPITVYMDTTKNITANYNQLNYTVIFNVTDGTNPLQNAAVTFNSTTINTDASGDVVFNNVGGGTGLAYSIILAGYTTVNGTVNATANITENVTMSLIPPTTYTLTVNSGAGDGNYEEAEVVNIDADAPTTGQVFDAWTGDVTNVANVNAASTTITMPSAAVTITATYVDLEYTITFNVNDGTNPLQNAAVTFNSTTINTDASGDAVFSNVVYGTDLAYSIVASGYNTESGTVDATSDLTENVTMTAVAPGTYTVTFTVDDGTSPIEGANVNFNSQEVLTNTSGEAVFAGVSNGTGLMYTVTMTGYDSETGTLNVSDADVDEAVSLTLTAPTTYTVTVTNGTGSGDYQEGATVNITANAAPIGQEFDKWTGDTTLLSFATATTTSFNMPDSAIELTATYKDIEIIDALSENELIFEVYPNPASNVVNICSNATIEYMQLINITGKVVLEGTLNSQQSAVNISQIPSGIYFMNLNMEDNIHQIIKFIKK